MTNRAKQLLFALISTITATLTFAQPQIVQVKATPLTDELRAQIVDSVSAHLKSTYVFPQVADDMSALIMKNLAARAYDKIPDVPSFCERLTVDLQSISKDRHLNIIPLSMESLGHREGVVSPEAERDLMLREERWSNFGFKRIEHLPGNIGLLKLDKFTSADIAGPTAIAAMNFLGNCDALIFDLRENGGGDPSLIQLISSYLFEQPTHLNSFFIRSDSSLQQFWTHAHVEGPRLTDVPVYVLTSSYTFSGAEEFAYNLKTRNRGTIVGEVTGGGAHPVHSIPVPSLGISIGVPFGRAVNPLTNTNWEGVGVQPDIACSAGEAFDIAVFEALRAVRDKTERPGRRAELEWEIAGKLAARNPVVLTAAELKKFAGEYGPRRVTFESDALYYQRESGPKRRMVAMSKSLFSLDGLDFFRAEFIVDDRGKVREFVGHYRQGHTDRNERTN